MAGRFGNRPLPDGKPQNVQRSSASQLKEHEPAFDTYEHLQGLPRTDAALTMLRKVGSLVKPIMRKRGWHVQVLAEFLPPEQNLLGLNINKGYKICLRLRFHHNPDLFIPLEQVVDTMLHELSHIIWGAHDSNFHALWDELRDEHETLIRKGYSGEGFLSAGHKLGGGRVPPPHEMRRLAHASAEKRRVLSKGSGQKLGGTPLHRGQDVRKVIADAATRRTQNASINKGCASGTRDAGKLSDEAANHTFTTKAEEDDANDRAIAQAIFDLMEEEEERKLKGTFQAAPTDGGLAWSPENGLYTPDSSRPPSADSSHRPELSEEEQLKWAMQESMKSPPAIGVDGPPSQVSLPVPDVRRPASAPPMPDVSKPILSRNEHRPAQSGTPASHFAGAAEAKAASKRKRLEGGSSPSFDRKTASATLPDHVDLTNGAELPANGDNEWACEVCTCINPLQFLACDACGVERPPSVGVAAKQRVKSAAPMPTSAQPSIPKTSLGWNCTRCGAFMEHKWWTCSACGTMKVSS